MQNTQLLTWDSHILGISVAKIICPKLNSKELYHSLQKLKEKGIQLVYWCIDSHDSSAQHAASFCRGFLADEKITYIQELKKKYVPLSFPYQDVEGYGSTQANSELERIAIEISKSSRFRNDPKLTTEQTHQLYKHWINNACQKIVANIVLVIKNNTHHIIGMITIDEKQGRADLSLVGVHPAHQGQGIGKRLVCAATDWSLQHNYEICQVVTQKTNLKAQKLYESCGFNEEKREYFYHFWL